VAKSPRRRIVDFAIRALPDAIEDDARRILGLEVKRTARAAPKALPAPPKPLALPAPGPGLPPLASKPRGGQWWADREIAGVNSSPEAIARKQAGDVGYRFLEWQPDDDYGLVSLQVPDIPKEQFKVQDWLARALAKYYKNDFGAPDDPLRGLAERGLHYDPDMTPEKWNATVNSYLMEDPIQSILFPPNLQGGMPGAGSDLRGETLAAMPWLAKQPVTEKVYGISGGLDLEHFADEFYNALHPEVSGLPMSLAVRPESLDRMTFAQAAEHVGKINQYRAKEMQRAALAAQDSPAVWPYKTYSENNPRGLRWVELKAPENVENLLDDADRERLSLAAQEGRLNPQDKETILRVRAQRALEDALKYEGDTMGHCVGGYCPDVMSGRSRIFSLRDAKGEPHVTIETQRGLSPIQDLPYDQIPEDLQSAYQNYTVSPIRETSHITTGFPGWLRKNDPDLFERYSELLTPSENIIQIKGKQNRAPKDDYLPFVQDFVKSQQFGNVGDLANTGLVRLPDGRYLTHDQMDEIIRNESLDDRYQSYDFNARGFPRDPAYMDPEDWAQFQRHFEGYAIGGRVDADRCFCHNPLSVKKGR